MHDGKALEHNITTLEASISKTLVPGLLQTYHNPSSENSRPIFFCFCQYRANVMNNRNKVHSRR